MLRRSLLLPSRPILESTCLLHQAPELLLPLPVVLGHVCAPDKSSAAHMMPLADLTRASTVAVRPPHIPVCMPASTTTCTALAVDNCGPDRSSAALIMLLAVLTQAQPGAAMPPHLDLSMPASSSTLDALAVGSSAESLTCSRPVHWQCRTHDATGSAYSGSAWRCHAAPSLSLHACVIKHLRCSRHRQ